MLYQKVKLFDFINCSIILMRGILLLFHHHPLTQEYFVSAVSGYCVFFVISKERRNSGSKALNRELQLAKKIEPVCSQIEQQYCSQVSVFTTCAVGFSVHLSLFTHSPEQPFVLTVPHGRMLLQ